MSLSDDFFEPFEPARRPDPDDRPANGADPVEPPAVAAPPVAPRAFADPPDPVDLDKPDPVDLDKPGPGDADEPVATPERIGQNEHGRIEVSSRAVEKIAALASLEVEHTGGTSGRLLGIAGRRRSGVSRIPKVSADIDGGHVFLDVELSVRWPAPIAQVAAAVRERLITHVSTLVGLEVSEVDIQVVDLVPDAPAARVS